MLRILYILYLLLLFPAVSLAEELNLHPVKHLFNIKGPPSLPFSLPTDLVVGRNGKIYVLDGLHNRVKVFNKKGVFLSQFGSQGNRGGKFDEPVGIGIDLKDNIYICDTKNGRIVIFNSQGAFLRDITLITNEGMSRPRPVDIAINDKRKLLYISDNANHTVLVYTIDGGFVQNWGERGGGEDEFRYPATMALKGKKLFVTDVLGTRVQVINVETGEFMGQIGSWGVLQGRLFRPKGVALDSKGLIYVTDSYMDVIQVFNEFGDLKYVLGKGKGEIRRFITPASIFIDKNNSRLYVMEVMENRVGVYRIK